MKIAPPSTSMDQPPRFKPPPAPRVLLSTPTAANITTLIACSTSHMNFASMLLLFPDDFDHLRLRLRLGPSVDHLPFAQLHSWIGNGFNFKVLPLVLCAGSANIYLHFPRRAFPHTDSRLYPVIGHVHGMDNSLDTCLYGRDTPFNKGPFRDSLILGRCLYPYGILLREHRRNQTQHKTAGPNRTSVPHM